MKALVQEQEINKVLLSQVECKVLEDICEFLYAPHTVQELLSAEKTPTLSLVLPTYEQLILLLKNMMRKLDKLCHAISTTIQKLEEYFSKSRRTRIYALAMSKSFTFPGF